MNGHKWTYKNTGYAKKGTYRKASNNTRSIATRALAGVKKINREVELKYHDTTISDSTVAQTGYSVQLSSLSQGDTVITMEGDKCRLTSVQAKLMMQETVGNGAPFQIRVVLVRVKVDSLGTTTAQFLEDSSALANIYSLYEKTEHNYKILYDRVITVTPQINSATNKTFLQIKKKLNVTHSLALNSVDNSIHLHVMHNHTDQQLKVDGRARLHFKDI